jgi:hypothetical protein
VYALVGQQIVQRTPAGTRDRVTGAVPAGYEIYFLDEVAYLRRQQKNASNPAFPMMSLDAAGAIMRGSTPSFGNSKALSDSMAKHGDAPKKAYQTHHLLAGNVARGNPMVTAAMSHGRPAYSVDHANNGVRLPSDAAESVATGLPIHLGSHPTYDDRMEVMLDNAWDNFQQAFPDVDPSDSTSWAPSAAGDPCSVITTAVDRVSRAALGVINRRTWGGKTINEVAV